MQRETGRGEIEGRREGRGGERGKREGAPPPTKTEMPLQNRRKEKSRAAGRETS